MRQRRLTGVYELDERGSGDAHDPLAELYIGLKSATYAIFGLTN